MRRGSITHRLSLTLNLTLSLHTPGPCKTALVIALVPLRLGRSFFARALSDIHISLRPNDNLFSARCLSKPHEMNLACDM